MSIKWINVVLALNFKMAGKGKTCRTIMILRRNTVDSDWRIGSIGNRQRIERNLTTFPNLPLNRCRQSGFRNTRNMLSLCTIVIPCYSDRVAKSDLPWYSWQRHIRTLVDPNMLLTHEVQVFRLFWSGYWPNSTLY